MVAEDFLQDQQVRQWLEGFWPRPGSGSSNEPDFFGRLSFNKNPARWRALWDQENLLVSKNS
jgi:hypothetical protein